jgi:5'-methylthioadenosine phosphorylase
VNLSFVTDADAGLAPSEEHVEAEGAVTHQLVMERLAAAQEVIKQAIASIVGSIPTDFAPRELVPADASAAIMEQHP